MAWTASGIQSLNQESLCCNSAIMGFYLRHPPWMARVGEWLSLVEHLVRDQGVGGSNPLSPTIYFQAEYTPSRSLKIPTVGKNATVLTSKILLRLVASLLQNQENI